MCPGVLGQQWAYYYLLEAAGLFGLSELTKTDPMPTMFSDDTQHVSAMCVAKPPAWTVFVPVGCFLILTDQITMP